MMKAIEVVVEAVLTPACNVIALVTLWSGAECVRVSAAPAFPTSIPSTQLTPPSHTPTPSIARYPSHHTTAPPQPHTHTPHKKWPALSKPAASA